MDKSPRRKMQSRPVSQSWILTLHTFAIMVVALVLTLTGYLAVKPAQPSAAATVSGTYTPSPCGVTDVSVYREEELGTRTRLGSDGAAICPLIGTLPLGGKTVADANALIQKR